MKTPKKKSTAKKKPAAKKGRPTILTDKLCRNIVAQLTMGKTMTEICSQAKMPCKRAYLNWKTHNKTFAKKLVKAEAAFEDRILDLVRQGVSQKKISEIPTFPSYVSITRRKIRDPEFARKWYLAWQESADWLADEALEIVDNTSDDFELRETKDGQQYLWVDKEAIARSALRANTRIRLAESRKPTVYGRKLAVEIDDKEPTTPEEVNAELMKYLKKSAANEAKDG